MAKKGGWYKTGEEGRESSRAVDTQAKARAEASGTRRFWLEPDSSKKFTFLDNPEFFFWEHNLKLAGKWFNFFTCIKDFETCPICEDGNNSGYGLACTVIDHTKFQDTEGVWHQNEKRLVVFKGKARQRILTQMAKRDGDLKYCVFETERSVGKTECSTGEVFDFLKRLTKKDVKRFIPKGSDEKWLEPLDYEEEFAPKTAEELRGIIGGEVPVGAESGAKTQEDDTFPSSDKEVGGEDAPGNDEPMSIDDLM